MLEPVVRELGARELTTDAVRRPRSRIVGAGLHNAPGLRRADVRHARRCRREHRDDLDVGGPDHLHDRRGRASRAALARAPRRVRAGTARARSTPRPGWRSSPPGPGPTAPTLDAASCQGGRPAQERFESVGSTNDVVRAWLAARHPRGLPRRRRRADGRSRARRAPVGRAAGQRPAPVARVPPRLARAGPSLAAGRDRGARDGRCGRGGRRPAAIGAIRLKWPNDLVVETIEGRRRSARSRPVSRLASAQARRAARRDGRPGRRRPDGPWSASGSNADWAADDFPADLVDTMTSLQRGVGRPSRSTSPSLLDAFLGRLEVRIGGAAWRAVRRRRLDRPPDHDRPDRAARERRPRRRDRGPGAGRRRRSRARSSSPTRNGPSGERSVARRARSPRAPGGRPDTDRVGV